MNFRQVRTSLERLGMQNAALLFAPMDTREACIFFQEVELEITWEPAGEPGRRRNVSCFYHYERERGLLRDKSSPWGNVEVSYFSSCSSPCLRNFDDEARSFKFFLRTQEFVTENAFGLLVEHLWRRTRAGRILARRMEGGSKGDIRIRTRSTLCGGREEQGEKAVFTTKATEFACPADFPSEDRDIFLKKALLQYYRRDMTDLQEKYRRMLNYIKTDHLESGEFLLNVFSFCRLATWYDVNFDELRMMDRRRLFE